MSEMLYWPEIKHILSLQTKCPLEHLNSKYDPIAGEVNNISRELLAGEMGEFRQTPSDYHPERSTSIQCL